MFFHSMSNKKKLTLAGIAVLVLILGGVFFAFSGSKGQPVTATLSDLSARQGSWQCAFTFAGDDVTSSGTVYISNGRLRGDFVFNISPLGQKAETHIIRMNGFQYSWNLATQTGEKKAVAAGPSGGAAGTSPDQAYPYHCVQKSVDESLFSLPSGIVFTPAK